MSGVSSSDETALCHRCGERKDVVELDRLLWCAECRRKARERAALWGWGEGIVFGAFVAAYILLVIRPTDIVTSGWVATVLAAVWIGGRLGREITYGIIRYARTGAPGADARGTPSQGREA